MSYYIVYARPDDPPEDGDQIATGRGWLHWSDYVLTINTDRPPEQHPNAAHLADHGFVQWGGEGEPADAGDLTHELEELTHAEDGDVAAVSARLLAALVARPADCCGVLITDGTEPGSDEEDDDDDA